MAQVVLRTFPITGVETYLIGVDKEPTERATWTIDHNLGTQDVVVFVADHKTDQMVYGAIQITGPNTIELSLPEGHEYYAVVSDGTRKYIANMW